MIRNIVRTQKIIKVGNSYALTLDRTFLEKAGVKPGDYMMLRYNYEEQSLTASAKDASEKTYRAGAKKKLTKSEKEAYLSKEITPEYQEWVRKTLEEDREAMEALKNL